MNRRDATLTVLGLTGIFAARFSALAADAHWNLNDPAEFQARCLRLGREIRPELKLQAPPGQMDLLLSGEIEIGLQNLHARFLQSDRTDTTLRELLKQHLSLATKQALPRKFEEASRYLLPQLMPAEYRAMEVGLSFPFALNVLIGLVYNHEKNYQYLRRRDLQTWRQLPEATLSLAITNLERLSADTPMQVGTPQDAQYVGVETKDGFDAARILVPSLRTFIGSQLGSPFLFGVPNRDFLICWSKDSSEKFHAFARNKILEDHRSQPYPLSARIFEVTQANEIRPTA